MTSHADPGREAAVELHIVPYQLMTPDEVMTMSRDQLVLLRPGFGSIAPQWVRSQEGAEFRGIFGA
jgi:hypothetical protein